MDELTLLRRVRADVAGPTDAALAAGRAELEAAWAAEAAEPAGTWGADAASRRRVRGARPRRRVWRRAGWTAGGVTVALGLATVLVLTNVVGLAGWRGGASPAAASVLHAAADIAAHASDPVVEPGQYLELRTKAVYATYSTDASSGSSTGFLQSSDERIYIPADRSKTWIWVRSPRATYQTFGAASEEAAKADSEQTNIGTEWVANPGGDFYGSDVATETTIASLPNDPTRLLNYIYLHTLGQGNSRDGEALSWIADQLRTGAVPAAERAVMYRAAAMIPGVEVAERQANLNGRSGVAIGYAETTAGYRQDLIIDPDTGAFIGEREVLLRPDGVFPAGTAQAWTAVTTTVADGAPRATPDGGFDASGCTPTNYGEGSYTCPSK